MLQTVSLNKIDGMNMVFHLKTAHNTVHLKHCNFLPSLDVKPVLEDLVHVICALSIRILQSLLLNHAQSA